MLVSFLKTKKILNRLGKHFGYIENKKGFKVLNPKVKILWGDGIDYNGIQSILFQLMITEWSTENIVFGMGGGLLQKINRDTQRFAFKCSAQKRNDEWYQIFKNPIDKSKASKKGKLALIQNGDTVKTITTENENEYALDILKTVFLNGHLIEEYSIDQIRLRAACK